MIGAVSDHAVRACGSPTGDLRRGFNNYDVVFDDPVRGLTEGGEVRFNGIKVGEVESLRIDPDNTNRVIARIRVSSDVPVKTDTEAQLEPIGLTGVTLIQLSAGSADAELLRAPPSAARRRASQGRGSQIDVIVARGEEVALRASEAMAAVRDLLTDENIARVTRIVRKPRNASPSSSTHSDSVVTQSGEAAREIADARAPDAGRSGRTRPSASIRSTTPPASPPAKRCRNWRSPPKKSAAPPPAISRVANNLEENPSVLTPRSPRPTVELEP